MDKDHPIDFMENVIEPDEINDLKNSKPINFDKVEF